MNTNKHCLIIGFGRMGQRWHHILTKLKFRNIYIVEKSKKNFHKTTKNNKLLKNKIFHKIEDALKFCNPTIGIVSTTADMHKEFVVKLAKNRVKNIIVEKPMATSPEDCNEMIKACRKFKSKLTINHQTRFTDEIKLIKKIILKYRLGKLISMNVIGGNSGLAMGGVHYIEIFNYLTKKKIVQVSSYLENKKIKNPRGKQFQDNSGQIIAKNNDDQTLYLNLSYFQSHGVNTTYTFKNGNILINRNGLLNINIRKRKYFNYPSNLFALPEYNKNIKFKQKNLIESTKNLFISFLKNKNYPSGLEAAETIKTLVAAIESNKINGKYKKLSKINNTKNYPWA